MKEEDIEYKKRLDRFLGWHFVDRTLLLTESDDFQALVGKTTIEGIQGVLDVEFDARNEFIRGKHGECEESQYVPRSVNDRSGFENG
jgi:hypothetical protein